MTKKQILAELEKRMVFYNKEVEHWDSLLQDKPQNEFLNAGRNYAYAKAVAYEDAWKLVKGE